jgi:hypothetical protein
MHMECIRNHMLDDLVVLSELSVQVYILISILVWIPGPNCIIIESVNIGTPHLLVIRPGQKYQEN